MTRLLFATSSYPVDPQDWKGRFIADMSPPWQPGTIWTLPPGRRRMRNRCDGREWARMAGQPDDRILLDTQMTYQASGAKRRLLIVGVYKASEGYPNVRYRLDFLRALPDFDVIEINTPLWSEDAGHRALKSLPRLIVRALAAHTALLIQLMRSPKADLAYVPYPAPSVLLLLACLPRCKAPGRVLADAFISLYDTVVNDRRLFRRDSLRARMLFRIEQRAFAKADRLIVDTTANISFFCDLFGLSPDRLRALPLSTNEVDYRHIPYRPQVGRLRVLFIGTMIPLHGVSTIIEAAVHLRQRQDIEFHLIGDGQTAPEVENLLARHRPNLMWQRSWQTPGKLAAAICEADICLGVFSDSEKAQRVLPYKIYAYAAVGRAIITARSDLLENLSATANEAPFALVPPADPGALAEKIIEMADDPIGRSELAVASRRFYESTLSNSVAHPHLKAFLEEFLRA